MSYPKVWDEILNPENCRLVKALGVLTFDWTLCLQSLVETFISMLSRAWAIWFVPAIYQRPTYCKSLCLAFTTKFRKKQAMEM